MPKYIVKLASVNGGTSKTRGNSIHLTQVSPLEICSIEVKQFNLFFDASQYDVMFFLFDNPFDS